MKELTRPLSLSLSIKGINLYRNCQPPFLPTCALKQLFSNIFLDSYFLHQRRPCFQYPAFSFSRQPHKVPLNLPLNTVFLHGKARRRTRYGITPVIPQSLRRVPRVCRAETQPCDLFLS